MKNPMVYLRRCGRLRQRGLCDQLWRDLREAGDESLLGDVETLSDEDLAALNRRMLREAE